MEIIFWDIMYILHHNTIIFGILLIFHTLFTLILLKSNKLQIKSENEQNPYMVFNGIDHSNPYIHSTTILCDNI